MEELRREQLAESNQKNMTAWRLLRFPGLRWNLITVVILVSGSQFVGVNMGFVFAERIYKALGLSTKAKRLIPLAGNVIVQLMLLTTICTVETLGRKFLLLTGFLICSVSNISLVFCLKFQIDSPSLAFLSIVLIILFFLGYITGPDLTFSRHPASISVVIIGELFLQSSRMSAFVIAGLATWITRFISALLFLLTEPRIGPYSLLLYWPFIILTSIYILWMVPETSGKTFQEIQKSVAAHVRKHSRKTVAE
ncbi:solute carrier family 2, facilitated glucose transporter member 5-like isoform 1-T1 [Liasis olivaceus]